MSASVGLSLSSAALTALLTIPSSLAVDRMPADEDRTTQAQHIHHPLPAVDHCHRAHLPCGDPRGEAREMHTHTHTHLDTQTSACRVEKH